MLDSTATPDSLLDDTDGVHAAALAELPPLDALTAQRIAALARSTRSAD